MKTRNAIAAAATIAAVLLFAVPAEAAETYDIDTGHSMVLFKVLHFGVGKSIGRFNDITGSFTFDAANPSASSFEVTIQTESVDTALAKRDQHLRSPDFFNAKQFPVITLKSKSVKAAGKGRYQVTAELNLHGVKKEIEVEIQHIGSGADPWGNQRAGFEADFSVKRGEYGINYMPDALGDEVEMIVAIEGVQQK